MAGFGRFEGEVDVRWLRQAGRDRDVRLLADFAYVDPQGKRWLAARGRVVNGASIPEVLWSSFGPPFVGDYRRGSVLHDVACEDRTEPSEDVHRMFYNAIRCDGVGQAKALTMYWAVKLFGPRWNTGTELAAPAPSLDVTLEQIRSAVETTLAEVPGEGNVGALDRRIEALLSRMDTPRRDSREGRASRTTPPGASDSMLELPADGRYELSNDVLRCRLRVDEATSGMVSGDLFAVLGEAEEHLASFRTRPGVRVGRGMNAVAIVADGRNGTRSTGTLAVEGTLDALVVRLRFDDQLFGLPVAADVVLTGRRVSGQLRELGLEIESESGVSADVEWSLDGRTVTIESAFRDAGIEVVHVGRRSAIPTPTSGEWDMSQLHGLMMDFAQEPLDRPTWNLHLLVLSRATHSGLLGVMFDSGSRDVNRLPRQGAAVFVDPIKTRPDWQRKLIQTILHETGHALNLAHRFERPVGRADSTSFMNYDWKYRGGGSESQFWREFRFTFDADELAFLRHGPWNSITPGTAEFHTVPYWENTDGGYVPYVPERGTHELSLEIVPPGGGALFRFGQQVFLTVRLHNHAERPIHLPPSALDVKAGALEFVIKRRSAIGGGDSSAVFRPVMLRCYDMETDAAEVIPPGSTIEDNVNLTFGSAGFTFAEPGLYDLQAVFTWERSGSDIRTIKSTVQQIRVAHPADLDEERDAFDLFRWDVGYYLALGGSAVLANAEKALASVADRRQGSAKTTKDPLVAGIRRAQALGCCRDTVRYAKGKFDSKAGDLQEALGLLDQIAPAMNQAFDPVTAKATAKLRSSIERKVKK